MWMQACQRLAEEETKSFRTRREEKSGSDLPVVPDTEDTRSVFCSNLGGGYLKQTRAKHEFEEKVTHLSVLSLQPTGKASGLGWQ